MAAPPAVQTDRPQYARHRAVTTYPMTVTDEGKIRRHRHWGFGGGAHRCFGMHLALLELGALIEEWLKRIPEFEPAPDYTPELVNTTGTLRLHTLPLIWPKPDLGH